MARTRRSSKPSLVRIIGGQWRGRKLPVCTQPGLRPTPDRVRETLFNWLSAWVPGSHCLDCFSGSGALALEALSRGAESALMIESSRDAASQLRANLELLNAQNGQVKTGDSMQLLDSRADQQYDLVFLDPPFRQEMLVPCARLLEEHNWLAKDAMIYVEAESEWPLAELPESWQLYREKKAGQVAYRLFQRSS